MSESLSNNQQEETNDQQEENRLRDRAIRSIDKKLSEEIENSAQGVREILGVKEALHELQVHQIELEMQNEELNKTSEQLEQSRNQYQNLYDFAPIGYFSLDKEGIIRNANFMGISLLKMERNLLKGKAFQYFISREDKSSFHAFLRRVFSSAEKQSGELRIINKNKEEFFALVEGIVLNNSSTNTYECLTAVIDISEQKKAQAIIKASLEEKERLNIIIATQEEERKRISEALHNSIAQLLFAAQIKLEISMESAKENSDLKQVHALIQNSLNETRTISFELMPPILREFGLKETLREFCRKRWTSELKVNFIFSGQEKRLDNFIEIAIYRIVQELYNNIVKHAQASEASIYFEIVKKYIKVYVEDNGIGFNEAETLAGIDKMGLRNIRNRVCLMNGSMDIKTAPRAGTIISIEIPFE